MNTPQGAIPTRRGRPLVWLTAIAAGLVLFLVGREVGSRTGRAASLSDEVIDVVRSRYREPVNPRKLQRTAVDAVIGSLNDPYTAYLDPAALKRANDQGAGAYSGVGIRLDRNVDRLVVASVFPKGPAATGGVRVGDVLLAVDGRLVTTLRDVAGSIVGKEGTVVRLRVATGSNAPREASLTRRRITAPAVASEMKTIEGRKVGYVELFGFTKGSGGQTRGAVTRLVDQGATGLVLDLRGDLGGFVSEAITAASTFLPKGATIATTKGAHEKPETLKTKGGTATADLPLVVLVDQNSASASEILAGALRDNGRATLVGTRTFGKARIQVTQELQRGGALKVTIASYLTPSGLDISDRGLPPAVFAVDNPKTNPDEPLERALLIVTGRAPTRPPTVSPVTG